MKKRLLLISNSTNYGEDYLDWPKQYVKEFLEVKFEISSELTYREMIDELKNRHIDLKLKNQLIEFFREMSIMIYAPVPKRNNFSHYHSLAKKTIMELGENDVVEK